MISRKLIPIIVLFVLFGSLNGFSQTYKWGHVAIGGTGFVDGIVNSKRTPNVRYARTDVGGAYRWDSTATRWIPLTDWVSEDLKGYLAIESMALDPKNDSNLYLLAGTSYFSNGKTAILISKDGGNTFTTIDVTSQFRAHGNSMGRQNGERLAIDPNLSSILFCGTENNIGLSNTPCLFKSTNSGASWTAVPAINTIGQSAANNNGVNIVLFDPTTGTKGNATQTIIFGVSQTGTNLYISTDGGSTINPIAGAPTNLMPQRATITSNRMLYVTYADKEGPWNPASGAIWRYNLVNGQWKDVSPVAGYSYSGISVDPNNPARLIASTINKYLYQYTYNGNMEWGDHFYLSTDSGSTWRDLVANPITVNPNGCTWIAGATLHWAGVMEFNPLNTAQATVGSGNGLFTCTNVNATTTTWNFDGIGIEESVPLNIASIPAGPLFTTIGDYDGFKHSSVTTFAPQLTPTMGSTSGFAYAGANTNYLVRVGSSMYYSTDQGANWNKSSVLNSTMGNVAVSANGSVVLHCPDKSTTTYRTTNNGTSWTNTNLSITSAVPVGDPVNSNKFYAYNSSSGSMMVSTDGGITFNASGNPGSGGSQIIRTNPGVEGDIWVALSNGIAHSTNSGLTFTTINTVSWCESIGLGKAAPAATYPTIYIWGTVGGVTGLFSSINQGSTWTRLNDNAHQYGGPGNGEFVIGDWNIYGRVYMSSIGLGIIYGDINTTTTPTVTVAVSSSASTICAGTSITLTATTTVSNGTISKVDFYDGTSLLGSSTTAPYTYSWTNASSGSHSITAKATDNTATVTTSTAITETVNAIPAAPTVTTPVTYCQNATATALTATGTALKWYAVATGGSALSSAPIPSTSVTGTTNYYPSQTIASCESARATLVVTINATPTAPTVTTPVSYCKNATATAVTATGTSLKWYTVATGGTALPAAPTPSTTATGTTDYYPSQTTGSCESARATLAVIVSAIPAAPTVTTPVNYCQNASATGLTATGTTLKWYTVATGGTALSSVPTPSTTASGSTNYYVSQSTGSCESSRATLVVTVNAIPTVAPFIQVNGGTWQSATSATVTAGQSLAFGPQPTVATGWAWTGPNAFTASTRQISFTSVTASQNGIFTGTYTDANGCSASVSQTITVLSVQTIALSQGWNLISSNLYPTDSSIATVFNGLNVQEIKTADAFWELGQVNVLNRLNTITAGNAYLVNMNTAGSLQIVGNVMNTSNYPSSTLKTGWNLIGCPFQTSSSLSAYFNTSNTVVVKDFIGFWIPGGSINSITTLDPGKGYYIKK